MPFQDWTTYTEVDPQGEVALTAGTITATDMARDVDAYVYKDFGAGAFSGSWRHNFEFSSSRTDGYACIGVWAVRNQVSSAYVGGVFFGGDSIALSLRRDPGGDRVLWLDVSNGDSSERVIFGAGWALDTTYYVSVWVDLGASTYGTVFCNVYSDAARSNLLYSASKARAAAIDYRYAYGLISYNLPNPSTYAISASVSNLEFDTAVHPDTEDLTIVEQTPAVAVAPSSSANLTVTEGTPVATKALAVYPTSAGLTITEGTPTILIPLQPTTGLLEITGQTPTLETFYRFNAALDLPALTFEGTTSRNGSMALTLPALTGSFASASGLALELPEFSFSGQLLPGTVGDLTLDLPALTGSFVSGSRGSLTLPALAFSGEATPGTVSALSIRLPALTAAFTGQTTQPGALALTLPALRANFSLSAESLSSLSLTLPALTALFEGYAGQAWTMGLEMPALTFEGATILDTESDLVLTLPALRALIESHEAGRFDSYLLYFRRPS